MKKIFHYILALAIVGLLVPRLSQAQIVRWMTVNKFVWALDAQGATWMPDFLSNGQNNPSIWYNWEPYPDLQNDVGYHGVDVNGSGHLSGHGKNLVGQASYWVGSTNWQSPSAGHWGPSGAEAVYTPGHTYTVFVNDNGPTTLNSLINTPYPAYAQAPKHVRRTDLPTIDVVEQGTAKRQDPIAFDPTGNPYTVDASLVADGMLETKWADPMGVTFHETRYGFSQPAYEYVQISELVVTNTGDANASMDGLEKSGQVLTDFWLGIKHNLGKVSAWADFGDRGLYDGAADWLVGYDKPLRTYYAWDGDANDIPGNDQFDPRGGPLETGQADIPTGEFLAPEVNGYTFFYISDGPENPGTATDDPNQPATFRYRQYKNMLSPVGGKGTMQEAWNWMTGADGNPAYESDFTSDPYQEVPTAQPHYDPVFGIGPYTTLNPNDSIKVVIAFGTGSIPEARAIELGVKAKQYVETNGAQGIHPDSARKEIFEGGRDSLFARFARAKALYESNYTLATFPPDPPNNVLITPGPKQATISWDPVDGAGTYRLYRAQGGISNAHLFEMLEETTGTSYTDDGLTRGANYYYYVTSVDDNTGMESPDFYSMINKEVVPYRPPEQQASWTEAVRVVPNPYNINGNTYLGSAYPSGSGYNFSGGFRDQSTLMFVNLPEQCEIKIYNSVGDLIRTLDHNDGSGDQRWWPMLTDNNTWPASGVYFYTIEATSGDLEGQVAMGKFVIIR